MFGARQILSRGESFVSKCCCVFVSSACTPTFFDIPSGALVVPIIPVICVDFSFLGKYTFVTRINQIAAFTAQIRYRALVPRKLRHITYNHATIAVGGTVLEIWEPCEIMCAPCGQLLPLLAVWASSNDTATAVGGGTRWVVVLSCTGVSRSALYVVHLGFVPTRDGRSPHPGIVCADAAAVHTYRFPSSRQGSLSLASSFNAP